MNGDGQNVSTTEQGATPAATVPGAQPPAAALPTLRSSIVGSPGASGAPISVDENKNVDVDMISAQFLKHWLDNAKKDEAEDQEPAPGSFAAKLKAAQTGLGGVAEDIQAGANAPLKEGQSGALAGALGTLAAHKERMTKEKQDALNQREQRQRSALNNIAMLRQVQEVNKQSMEIQDKNDARGTAYAKYREDNGFEVRHGVSEDAVKKEMSTYTDDQGRHFGDVYDIVPSGHMTVNGKSVQTYDLIARTGATLKISADDAQKFEALGIKNIPKDTALPYETYKMYHNMAAQIQTSNDLFEKAYGEGFATKRNNLALQASLNKYVVKGFYDNPESPLDGLNVEKQFVDQLLTHQDMLENYVREQKRAKGEPFDGTASQQELAKYKDELTEAKTAIGNFLAYGVTDKMRDEQLKRQTEEDKNVLGNRLAQAKEETNRIRAAAEKGDDAATKSAGRDLVDGFGNIGDLPKRVTKGQGGWYNTVLAAKVYSLEQYGVPFDWEQMHRDWDYAKNTRVKDTLGNIRSLNEPNGALDVTERAAQKLPQLDSQTINKVFSRVKTEFGNPDITAFQTSLLDFADLYAKIMGGGVGTDTSRQQALDLLKDAYSKHQLDSAFDIINQDLNARARGVIGRNRYLFKEYGADFSLGPWQGPKSINIRPAIMPRSLDEAKAGKGVAGSEVAARLSADDRKQEQDNASANWYSPQAVQDELARLRADGVQVNAPGSPAATAPAAAQPSVATPAPGGKKQKMPQAALDAYMNDPKNKGQNRQDVINRMSKSYDVTGIK